MDIQYLTFYWEIVQVYDPSSAILKPRKLWKTLGFLKMFDSKLQPGIYGPYLTIYILLHKYLCVLGGPS